MQHYITLSGEPGEESDLTAEGKSDIQSGGVDEGGTDSPDIVGYMERGTDIDIDVNKDKGVVIISFWNRLTCGVSYLKCTF